MAPTAIPTLAADQSVPAGQPQTIQPSISPSAPGSSDGDHETQFGDADDTKREKSLDDAEDGPSGDSDKASSVDQLITEKSRGVAEMDYLVERLNWRNMIFIYGGFALLSYVLSLNQYSAGSYLQAAVSYQYGQHSLQATIGVVTSVFQAMSQPPIAKFADAFGRVNAYVACISLYALGYIIVPTSNNIVTYAVGNSIYILGITGLFFLQNVIISDISSLRNRFWWCQFPNILQGINIWAASYMVVDFIGNSYEKYYNWRWGYGMFTILVPVLSMPIILTLYLGVRPSRQRRSEIRVAKKNDPSRLTWAKYKANPAAVTKLVLKQAKRNAISIFWQLDFIGLVLFTGGFGMFFVTITMANSRTTKWSDAQSICLLVFGAVLIAAFVLYETYLSPHPLLPFQLIKRRNVIGACLIALIHPMAGRIVNGYFTTFAQIAANFSVQENVWLSGTASFAAIPIAFVASLAVRHFRVLKPIIILGFVMQTLAFGLMIRFRQSGNSHAVFYVVQIMKGFGIGCISFPTQALIQSAAPHEHLSGITAAYLVIFYMSSGIGAAIGGAMWTNIVPNKIAQYMPTNAQGQQGIVASCGAALKNVTTGTCAYGNPFGLKALYRMDTPERQALNRAQDEAQRVIVIVGTVLCFVGLCVATFVCTNVRLPDTQSLPESELVEDAEMLRVRERREKLNKKNKAEVKAEKDIVRAI